MPETEPKEVLEYVRDDGKNPFREWLLSLENTGARAQVRVRIARLRLGNFGDARSVGEGVNELRLPIGPGYRIYFGRVGDKVVLLLCAGEKKTQRKDITRAKEYWRDYLGRST